ncbi:kinase-like domain-containing protein [Melanogaster broomeanus]|nr:kinase-like domain-containing protein [Melanogaster broomeanus]
MIIKESKGKHPGASVLVTSDSNNSGSGKVKTPNAFKQPMQIVDEIRSKFASDLTGYIAKEGDHPIASGGRTIDVAVKAIRMYSADDDDDTQKKRRLRREIETWLKLNHINILQLFGTTMGFGQFPAMVCPWIENGALTSYLLRRDDNLTAGERLILISDVALGLQYLHSQSIVHGDLSGANVLIQDTGRACITDLGLSMLLTELGGTTFVTSFHPGGTLRWTAPELLGLQLSEEENPPEVVPTPHSDVYSFGRIMLQVLTGKLPYHYYFHEGQVMLAISKGETPRRPDQELVTDRRWMFMQRCWSSVDAGRSRPSDEEMVEFTRKVVVVDMGHDRLIFWVIVAVGVRTDSCVAKFPESCSGVKDS